MCLRRQVGRRSGEERGVTTRKEGPDGGNRRGPEHRSTWETQRCTITVPRSSTGSQRSSPLTATTGSARERWLARCTAGLAEAFATGNVHLLPLVAQRAFYPDPALCEDCRGTGYSHDGRFDPCCCMGDEIPAYDLPRHARGDVIALVIGRPDGQGDVWLPCSYCDIGPIQRGPHSADGMVRVPWQPDCPTCRDTGWTFDRTVPGSDFY